jgi:aryl-alcohol dehydrogenase-like predicted oxidoreductase
MKAACARPVVMQMKPYGRSGFDVSILGLGAGQVGDEKLAESDAAQLLNTALDMGITLIDTARGYGQSEERIGRHLSHRRAEFVLSTKVGYGIADHADWSAGIIEAGVDEALRKMRTDHIDIVHLHSCELSTLQAGDVVDALVRVREKGKIRIAAYSGENRALDWAVASGRFGGVECSVNLFDQVNLGGALALARKDGLGVIAKRPLGNAPWRFGERPVGDYAEIYWERMHSLAYDTAGLAWDEFALRFSAWQPEVSCAIVGTASIAHLKHNVEIVAKGPLAAEVTAAVHHRFAGCGADWPGQV